MRLFASLGSLSAKFPYRFISLGILFVLVFSPFVARVEEEYDTNVLWVPKSRSWDEHVLYQSTFKQSVAYGDSTIVINGPLLNDVVLTSSNVLSMDVVNDHLKIVELLSSFTEFQDQCYRPQGFCLVLSLAHIFPSPPSTDAEVISTINSALSSQPQLVSLLGSPTFQAGQLISAKALSFKFFSLPVDSTRDFESKFEDSLVQMELTAPMSYLLGNSFTNEAGRAFSGDLLLLIVGISLSALAIFCLFYENGRVRILLPFVSLLVPFLAYSTSRGILGLLGFVSGQVNRFIIFLLLALSADDVFVILSTRRRLIQLNTENLEAETLKKAGSAILLTTLTNMAAIGTSSTSSLFSLRSFSYEGVVSIAVLFILQILIIVPMINKDKFIKPVQGNVSDFKLQRYPRYLRYFTFSLVVIGLVLSIFGTLQLEQRFEVTDLTPPDSYIRDYFAVVTKHFPRTPGHLVINAEAAKSWTEIKDIALTAGVAISSSNWLDSYPYSLTPVDLSQLRLWLDTSGAQFKNDVILKTNDFMSRVSISFESLKSPQEQVELVDKYRNVFDRVIGKVFVYAPSLPFVEQFRVLFKEAAQTLSLSLLSIFIITLIVIRQLKASLFCFGGVVLILSNVLGVLYLFDVGFSSIVVTGLCINSGIAIDYFLHLVEQFSTTKGGVDYRVSKSVWMLKRAIISGAVTTFVAIVPLAKSSTSVFLVFCIMLLSTVVLALVYSLVVAPLILPLFFSSKQGVADDEGSMMNIFEAVVVVSDDHVEMQTTTDVVVQDIVKGDQEDVEESTGETVLKVNNGDDSVPLPDSIDDNCDLESGKQPMFVVGDLDIHE
ncbi:hypothetical protein RCL1_000467 [Eukaryota sp. TZLM3-RCL]